MIKVLESLLDRWGYMPKVEHDTQIMALHNELRRRDNEKLDRLVKSINSVNMVKAKVETPISVYSFDNESKPTAYAKVDYDYPPTRNRFRIFTEIEVSSLQRVYEEISQTGDSYELDYLIRAFIHKVQRDIEVLMKMAL